SIARDGVRRAAVAHCPDSPNMLFRISGKGVAASRIQEGASVPIASIPPAFGSVGGRLDPGHGNAPGQGDKAAAAAHCSFAPRAALMLAMARNCTPLRVSYSAPDS